MQIARVNRLPESILELDYSIVVTEEAVAPFDGPGLSAVVQVSPYSKIYPHDAGLLQVADPSDRMIAIATTQDEIAGYLAVSRSWNRCALVDDVMISHRHRRSGIGRALMDEAVLWAREQDLPVVRLETQSSNVPACRFYESYGFTLGGYDRHLYDALTEASKPETALFWYLHLAA